MKKKPKDPKYVRALEESEAALKLVQSLLTSESGHALHAWLHHFDKDHNSKVSLEEFRAGMAELKWRGECDDLFRRIDVDGSGDVTLDEIDKDASKIWVRFRLWCVNQFLSPSEMIRKFADGSDKLSQDDFVAGLRRFGWQHGGEDLIFGCINIHDRAYISASYFRWFAFDKKKEDRKREAKEKAMRELSYLLKRKRLISENLDSFRTFLKKRFVTYLRAWRLALDTDGTMSIQRPALLKAVKDIDWPGDARLLWNGLDKDGSGSTSLQELHLRTASVLARFKIFCTNKYGTVVRAFQAFDSGGHGKITEIQFLDACRSSGFSKANRALFHGLHSPDFNCLYERDVVFLDTWKCPAYLVCEPNEQAAKQFKSLLLYVYHNYVKAWRLCLDKNSNNAVGWDDFDLAAKHIQFKGDVSGAWRYFDSEFDGVVTFSEFDQESYNIIIELKKLADEQFGGVKMTFCTLDTGQAGEMSTKQFRRSMSAYGYQGDLEQLFDALSTDRHGMLALKDIAFIDDWESIDTQINDVDCPLPADTGNEFVPFKSARSLSSQNKEQLMSGRMLQIALPKERFPLASSQSSKTLKDVSIRSLKAPGKSPYLPRAHRPRRGGRQVTRPNTNYYHVLGQRGSYSTHSHSQLPHVGVSDKSGRHESTTLESSRPEPTEASPTQMRVMSAKQLLLRQSGMRADAHVANDEPGDAWNIRRIHEKTISLRLRTLDLLGRTQETELEFRGTFSSPWSATAQEWPRKQPNRNPNRGLWRTR